MIAGRRDFLRAGAAGALALGAVPLTGGPLAAALRRAQDSAPWFRISLAEWSLHRTLFAGTMSNLDFPGRARELGFAGVEYVNSFFKDKAKDYGYLGELRRRCDALGVTSLLIMCDGEGRLGDPDDAARSQAVENHYRWVDAARFLGCHSIRVNAASAGARAEQEALAADGLRRLTEHAAEHDLNVIVENHGGLSSDGSWLAAVMARVDHPRCGTLPDFGNFRIEGETWYDRYQGVEELMPYAKAVSAKSHGFDAQGLETGTDYPRMLRIVRDAGYRAWVGVEFEGEGDEVAGILATKALLERVRSELG